MTTARVRSGAVALVLCALLAGCASTPTSIVVEDATGGLATATTWSMTGKLGVQAAQASGNLGIRWQQQAETFEIDLYGPLGVHVGQIGGDAESAWLDTGGERQQAATADALAETALGYPLPVSPMRYWVRGIPAPGGNMVRHADGFSQRGWRIRIIDAEPAGPGRMQLIRNDIRLLLVVREWRY